MNEIDKELIITKYAITETIFNRVGRYVEDNCTTQAICETIKEGQHCAYFRMEIEEILSGRREVEIIGLPSKREELELEELDFDLLQPKPPLSDNMTDRQKKNMEVRLSRIAEKEKFMKACEEKIRNNTFNNFDED